MKATQVFVPLFFSALAAAAPLDPRAMVTRVTTKVVYETVTLEPGQPIPTAQANNAVTSTYIPAQFYEQRPKSTPPSSSSSTSTYSPPPVVATPPPASSSSQYVPPPPPAPSSTSKYVPPPPPPAASSSSSSAAAPASSSGAGQGTYSGQAGAVGEVHDGVRFSAISNYNNPSGPVQKIETWGGCATYGQPPEYKMSDAAGDMRVALDVNVPNFYSYCGKKIRLTNPDGRTAVATIVDKCPKCGEEGGPYSLDLLESVWDAVGGGAYTNNVKPAKWEIIG